jgi:hypothetical protein
MRADGDPDAVAVGGSRWYRAASTTNSFGTSVRLLLEDEWLLRTAPFAGGAIDHNSWLAIQGYRPFGWRDLGGEPLDPRQTSVAKRAARRAALTVVRLALNAVALSRPELARRVIVAPDPDLITHLEEGHIAPGTDWAAEATEVAAWLRDRQTWRSR